MVMNSGVAVGSLTVYDCFVGVDVTDDWVNEAMSSTKKNENVGGALSKYAL